MLSPELGRIWFQVAVFILIVSAALAALTPAGSAEHVISIASLFIGILFLIVLVIVIRRSSH
ncbi:MAG: hypothetical protein K1X39_06200 [Thermoflexales bacterium]|nr:hypothetical protein [Thermoflexales bacterium]